MPTEPRKQPDQPEAAPPGRHHGSTHHSTTTKCTHPATQAEPNSRPHHAIRIASQRHGSVADARGGAGDTRDEYSSQCGPTVADFRGLRPKRPTELSSPAPQPRPHNDPTGLFGKGVTCQEARRQPRYHRHQGPEQGLSDRTTPLASRRGGGPVFSCRCEPQYSDSRSAGPSTAHNGDVAQLAVQARGKHFSKVRIAKGQEHIVLVRPPAVGGQRVGRTGDAPQAWRSHPEYDDLCGSEVRTFLHGQTYVGFAQRRHTRQRPLRPGRWVMGLTPVQEQPTILVLGRRAPAYLALHRVHGDVLPARMQAVELRTTRAGRVVDPPPQHVTSASTVFRNLIPVAQPRPVFSELNHQLVLEARQFTRPRSDIRHHGRFTDRTLRHVRHPHHRNCRTPRVVPRKIAPPAPSAAAPGHQASRSNHCDPAQTGTPGPSPPLPHRP